MKTTLLELYRKTPEKFRSFLFDVDGTVLLANSPIPGAPEFLDILRKDNVPFFFLTNNCAQTHEEIAQRLTKAGIYAEADQIISSGDPIPAYFKEINKTGKALRYFLVGRAQNIPGVIEYEKDPEKPFIVTNPDMLNPVESGVTICSNGQMELVIAHLKKRGIDKERIHFGKPFPAVYGVVKDHLAEVGVRPEETLAVGDWLNSDIRGANLSGIPSCLVLTGLSKVSDIANFDSTYTPTYIVSTLS